jgi:hypothetical protein
MSLAPLRRSTSDGRNISQVTASRQLESRTWQCPSPGTAEVASVRIFWLLAGGSWSLSSAAPYMGYAARRDQQNWPDDGE